MKAVKATTYIPDTLWEEIDILAKQNGESFSSCMRRILTYFMYERVNKQVGMKGNNGLKK